MTSLTMLPIAARQNQPTNLDQNCPSLLVIMATVLTMTRSLAMTSTDKDAVGGRCSTLMFVAVV